MFTPRVAIIVKSGVVEVASDAPIRVKILDYDDAYVMSRGELQKTLEHLDDEEEPSWSGMKTVKQAVDGFREAVTENLEYAKTTDG